MTHTANYNLPQWEADDPICRADFNQAMEDIDEGLDTAQSAAETAQSAASAAYSPDNKPYVTGTYTGNGNTRTITLGFRPSFLIIGGGVTAYSPGGHTKWSVLTDGSLFSDAVSLTDTGFTVYCPDNSNTSPHLAESGRGYCYIAFR